MKKLLVLTIAFLLGAPLSFAQETVPSQIKEVILFSNQALVKREAKADLRKGLNHILIELQAFQVDRDSVTAKVFGEGEIYSVQFKEIFLKESPQHLYLSPEDVHTILLPEHHEQNHQNLPLPS